MAEQPLTVKQKKYPKIWKKLHRNIFCFSQSKSLTNYKNAKIKIINQTHLKKIDIIFSVPLYITVKGCLGCIYTPRVLWAAQPIPITPATFKIDRNTKWTMAHAITYPSAILTQPFLVTE